LPCAAVPLSFRRHRIDEGVGLGIRIGAGVLAAVVVGAVLGAASRALMGLISVVATGSSSFSWSGSAFILLLYAAVMLPGGVVAGLTARGLRWVLPVAGALFLCVPAIGVSGEEIGSTVGFDAFEWFAVGAASVAIFLTIGLAPLLTVRLTDRLLGRRRGVVPTGESPRLPALR
jgi:hypothetical protein